MYRIFLNAKDIKNDSFLMLNFRIEIIHKILVGTVLNIVRGYF